LKEGRKVYVGPTHHGQGKKVCSKGRDVIKIRTRRTHIA